MIEPREGEAGLTDEQLEEKKRRLAVAGKSYRWRRFKSLKDGTPGIQQQEWPGGPCPFGAWGSEEKMNSMGNTWVL